MLSVRVTEKARNIKMLVVDVDGVLSDGRLMFSEDGNEIKAFDTQDGHGIKMLQRAGITVAIITGRTSDIVKRRAANLGVQHLLQGREDKLVALHEIAKPLGLALDEIAYVGDDWPDLPAIMSVGFGVAVANAHIELRTRADHVTSNRGGRGAVREVCDLILMAQGRYQEALAPYLAH